MSEIRCGSCESKTFVIFTGSKSCRVWIRCVLCKRRVFSKTRREAFAAIQKPSEPVNQQETSK